MHQDLNEVYKCKILWALEDQGRMQEGVANTRGALKIRGEGLPEDRRRRDKILLGSSNGGNSV